MMLLRQNQYSPMSRHRQVSLLVAAMGHTMEDIPLEVLNQYREELLAYIETRHDVVCRRIDSGGQLTGGDKDRLLKAARHFHDEYLRRAAREDES